MRGFGELEATVRQHLWAFPAGATIPLHEKLRAERARVQQGPLR